MTVRDLKAGDERTLVAPYFLDATELGDLLPMTGIEFVTGFEARSETGDLHAPERAQPENQQSFTCCFAMDYRRRRRTTRSTGRPSTTFWRDYVPKLTPAWPGKLFGDATDPITLKARKFVFDPTGAGQGFWVYRRIADAKNFRPGFIPAGMTLVNWPQNDYWLGNLVGVSADEAAKHVARAKQLSLSLLYWLQTEAPPDGGTAGRACGSAPTWSARPTGWPSTPTSASRGGSGPSSPSSSSTSAPRPAARRSAARTSPPRRSPTRSASAAIGSTSTRAPAATTTSTSARCRSRSRWEP